MFDPDENSPQDSLDIASSLADSVRKRRLRMLGSALLVLLSAALFLAWRSAGERAAEAAVERPPTNRLGPAEAPAQIVEYGDFGCPACRDWHARGIKEQLLAAYGQQISFEYRHFPVVTQRSPRAAEAAQCAGAQDAFWPYHDYLYEAARPGALDDADLVGYAAAVGLDGSAFADCLGDGRYRESVRIDWEAGRRAGARGAPTFTVNGRQVFPTYNGLAEAIEAVLAD